VYASGTTVEVTLIAQGQNACALSDTATTSFVVPEPYGYPLVDFDFTPVVPDVGESVLFSNQSLRVDSNDFAWDFGDGGVSFVVNPRHIYGNAGSYVICLYGENQFGCPDSMCKALTITVVVVSDSGIIDLPNAFTPNGDNNNDFFVVRGRDIEKMHLKIFNRWGELVFESRDPLIGWDGTYKDEPQEMEVYDWLLNATLRSGEHIFKKGNVTLLR
jgi:gliding motility-associated-like protein